MAYPQFIGRVPVKDGPRAEFQPEEFRRTIKTKGLNVVWQQNAECPCVQASTAYGIGTTALLTAAVSNMEDPLADCPVCNGDGYILHSPTPIKALVTTFDAVNQFQYFGEYVSSTMRGTFLPENLVSLGDRVTLTDCTMLFRETRPREASAIQSLRYPAVNRVLDLASGEFTVGVTYCHKADAAGVAIPGGVLYQDEDFVVDANGDIDWTLGIGLGTAPADGDRFSMSYFVAPVYVVEDLPFSVRDTPVKFKKPAEEHARMPVNAKLVLEFMNTKKDA